MSFTFLNQLPSPAEIKRDFPLSEENHVLGQLSLVVQIIQNATI